MEDIMKIFNLAEKNKNKAKEREGGFLAMLLDTLAASILGSALTGREVIRVGEGTTEAGQHFNAGIFFN